MKKEDAMKSNVEDKRWQSLDEDEYSNTPTIIMTSSTTFMKPT